MIPTELFRPEDIQSEIDEWIEEAFPEPEPDSEKDVLREYYKKRQRISDQIKDLRSIIANYNLSYLALPAQTDKAVALNVFINMNTNSQPLSQYDIIVAEVESVMGRSLHDLESALDEKHPEISRFGELSNLILTTSALLQGHLPNQRGAWDMDKLKMVENWNRLEHCLSRMAAFLKDEGIFDKDRLPTNAVLAPIAALYAEIPDSGDKRGQDELLLKKYLWHAFFTDRYENSAATHAFSDFNALKNIINGNQKEDKSNYTESDVPIFAHYELAELEELLTVEWPKRASIRGRAILAVMCRLGALDFSTGERLDANNVILRHYHHVYPDGLLKEADIHSYLALNCSLISDKTNLSIGRKDPLKYLTERYKWTTEAIVRERLQSHLIPIEELANGGYEGLSDDEKTEKLKSDFELFIFRRAELVIKTLEKLVEGRQLSASDIFSGGEDA